MRMTPAERIVTEICADVLGRDHLAPHDDVSVLSGDPGRLETLASRVSEVVGFRVPSRRLAEARTVAGMAAIVGDLAIFSTGPEPPPGDGHAEPALRRVDRSGLLPMSSAQQRLWFLEQLSPGRVDYAVLLPLRIRGQLNGAALDAALRSLIDRHDSLRTSFHDTDEGPRQRIHDSVEFTADRLDLTGLADPDAAQASSARITAEAEQPFDLACAPLIRVVLIAVSADEHVLVLVLHHIIADGWSCEILASELSALYAAQLDGGPPRLPDLAVQYPDFAVWQQNWLRGQTAQRQLAFWRARLGDLEPLDLPATRPRPARPTGRGGVHDFRLPAELDAALRELARRNNVTLFMTLLSVIGVLLRGYTGRSDIAIGTPVAGRRRVDVEGVVGLFVNTLVLRMDLSGNPRFDELLGSVGESAVDAYDNQDLPFDHLVDDLNPERDLSRNPIFSVSLAVGSSRDMRWSLPGAEVELLRRDTSPAKFDLAINVDEAVAGLTFRIGYATDLFDHFAIERMADQLRHLLRQVVANPRARLRDLSLLTDGERDKLLALGNGGGPRYPVDSALHQLVEAQAARTPDALAISHGAIRVTYGRLDVLANQLAHRLRRRGVGPEVLVPVCVDPGMRLIVALLAVLKAGGGYVPLDPSFPAQRLAGTVAEISAPVVITEATHARSLELDDSRAVLVDGAEWDHLAAEPESAPEVVVDPANAAYLVFTSGSTGRPKGVVVEHRSVVGYVARAVTAYPGLSAGGVLHSSVAFDLCVTSLWGVLASGGCLWVGDLANLEDVGGYGLLKATPSHLPVLMSLPPACSPVRELVLGGEALTGAALASWRARHPEVAVVNHWGPTEVTVGCTDFRIAAGESIEPGGVPIGRPFANSRLYVLGPDLAPVPAGVTGELYVGGGSVTRGYVGQRSLTAQRYVADPFAGSGARMYRTGDLGRWTVDGYVECLGRVDDQVKLRGFRVELGEVAAVLASCSGVVAAAAVVREDRPGDPRLVGYVTAPPGVDGAEVRRFAATALPEYMVPSAVVLLDALPMTANGKLDRRALPAPHYQVAGRTPRNAVEGMVADLFGEVLGVAGVGIDDNFFDLGGHSLLVIRLANRVRSVLRRELPVHVVFESPTVAGIAERLEHAEAARPALRGMRRTATES